MLDLSTQLVNIRKFPGAMEALQAASIESGTTGSIVLPAVMFKQGQRMMLSTAFPISLVRNRLHLNEATKRGGVREVRSATNRPTMPEHVESVKKYIKENIGGQYIIPPVTLNVRQPLNVYVPDYPCDLLTVYLVVPVTARLEITDGGHRKLAIDKKLL